MKNTKETKKAVAVKKTKKDNKTKKNVAIAIASVTAVLGGSFVAFTNLRDLLFEKHEIGELIEDKEENDYE